MRAILTIEGAGSIDFGWTGGSIYTAKNKDFAGYVWNKEMVIDSTTDTYFFRIWRDIRIVEGLWTRDRPTEVRCKYVDYNFPKFYPTMPLNRLETFYNQYRQIFPRLHELFQTTDFSPNYCVGEVDSFHYAMCDGAQQPTRCRLCAGSDWARKGVTHSSVTTARPLTLLEHIGLRGKCPSFSIQFPLSFVNEVNALLRTETTFIRYCT